MEVSELLYGALWHFKAEIGTAAASNAGTDFAINLNELECATTSNRICSNTSSSTHCHWHSSRRQPDSDSECRTQALSHWLRLRVRLGVTVTSASGRFSQGSFRVHCHDGLKPLLSKYDSESGPGRDWSRWLPVGHGPGRRLRVRACSGPSRGLGGIRLTRQMARRVAESH